MRVVRVPAWFAFLASVVAVQLGGCMGSIGPGPADSNAVNDGSTDDNAEADPPPVISPTIRAVLEGLSPATLPPPPADVSNHFADNPDAAALGQRFFFETRFSGPLLDGANGIGYPATGALGVVGETGKVSCTGCHIPTDGFVDTRSPSRQISLASDWTLRRARSLLDVGQASLLMWDGRADALYNQVFIPMEAHQEFNSSRLFVAEQVFALYRAPYEAVFGAMPPLDVTTRFPALDAMHAGCQENSARVVSDCRGVPGDHAYFDTMTQPDQDAVTRVVVNVGKAIGAYLRRISCGPGRFDDWMHGTGTLTSSEQRGAVLFASHCNGCHSGPYFSDQLFHNVGLHPTTVASTFTDDNDHGALLGIPIAQMSPLNTRSAFSDGDDGRLNVTVATQMDGSFRTPSLRCVSRRPSFMHTGQLTTLAQVVDFFARGGDAIGYEGTRELSPMLLATDQRADIVAFLHTLDGPGPAQALITAPP